MFFVAGIYLRKYIFLPLLFLTAFLKDYFVIQGGVSSWCVTPAYLALIPAYLALWFGGKRFDSLRTDSLKAFLTLAGVFFAGVAIAFLLSSGSFYFFSGRFENPDFIGFLPRIEAYFPRYAGNAFIYAGIAMMAQYGVDLIKSRALFRRETPSV